MSGCDTAVFGELAIPQGGFERYSALIVDPARRDDWIGNLIPRAFLKPGTVAETIVWIERNLTEPYFRITIDDDQQTMTIRGMLQDDDFLSYGADVAELFRIGSDVGARGELTFLGYLTSLHGFRVTVWPGGSSVRELDDSERAQAENSQAYHEVDQAVMQALAAQGLHPGDLDG